MQKGKERSKFVRAAFIAAPLIGTLIFMASLLFVVNLSKYETSQVSYLVSDAYHNRIGSLLEMYRSDMAAVFSVGLARSVEKFLLSQCWSSPPFGIQVDPTTFTQGNEQTQRKAFCQQLNSLVQSSVCTINPDYGFKNWLEYLKDPIQFEGISFEPANLDQFSKLTATSAAVEVLDPTTGERKYVSGNALCSVLISSDTFDCDAFARGELKCTQGLPGCDSGVFYVKVNVQDPQVYPSLPRVRASDGAGNVVRSGALSDQSFYVPVNFPLYKYYDLAYQYVHAVNDLIGGGYCVGDTADCAARNAQQAKLDSIRRLYFQASGGQITKPSINPRTVTPTPTQTRTPTATTKPTPTPTITPSPSPPGTSTAAAGSTAVNVNQLNTQLQPPDYALTGLAAQPVASAVRSDSSQVEATQRDAAERAAAKLVVNGLSGVIATLQSQPRFAGLTIAVASSTNYPDLLSRKAFVISENFKGADGVRLKDSLATSFSTACSGSCVTTDGKAKAGAYLRSLSLPSLIIDTSSTFRANPGKANDFCFTPYWVTGAQ